VSILREGTACRKYALQFPDFCYQLRIDVPLLDFTVECADLYPLSRAVMTVWFEPNAFTIAKERKRIMVIVVEADPARLGYHIDEMLDVIFNYKK
jgi:hypothetical protein